MTRWKLVLLVLISALLQATVLQGLRIFYVKPDLLFICVVFLSLSCETKTALGLSLLAGILKDIFSVNAFGVSTLLFSLSSLFILKLSRKISLDNDALRAALVFLLMLANGIASRFIFLFLGNFISIGIFLRVVLLESLYTAAVFPLVYAAIRRLMPSGP